VVVWGGSATKGGVREGGLKMEKNTGRKGGTEKNEQKTTWERKTGGPTQGVGRNIRIPQTQNSTRSHAE